MVNDPVLDRQFKGHKEAVTALAFNPVNNQLTSSSLDHSVLLWNSDKHMRSFKFHGHSDGVLDIAFNRSGKILASASRDKTIRLWVPTVTGETVDFKAHGQTVRSVHFSPCGTKLLTGSDDKSLKLWSVARRKFLMSFIDHKNWVRCARYSKDGAMIASCSDDKTVKLWDPDNGIMIHSYQERKGHGHYVAWHPSGTYMAVALSNGTIKLYDTRTHSLLQHYRVHTAAVTQIAFHPEKSFLLSSSLDSHIKILDLLEGAPIYTLSGHDNGVTAVAFSANGEYFASGGEDRQVMVWKTNFINNLVDTEKEYTQINELYHINLEDGKKISNSQYTKPLSACIQSNSQVLQENFILTNEQNPSVNEDIIHIYTEPIDEEIIHAEPSSKNTTHQTPYKSSQFEGFYLNELENENQLPRIPPTPEKMPFPDIPPLVLHKHSKFGLMSSKDSQNNSADDQASKRNSNLLFSDEQSKPKKTRNIESAEETACQTKHESIIPSLRAIIHHLGTLHNAITLAEERISLIEDVMNRSE